MLLEDREKLRLGLPGQLLAVQDLPALFAGVGVRRRRHIEAHIRQRDYIGDRYILDTIVGRHFRFSLIGKVQAAIVYTVFPTIQAFVLSAICRFGVDFFGVVGFQPFNNTRQPFLCSVLVLRPIQRILEIVGADFLKHPVSKIQIFDFSQPVEVGQGELAARGDLFQCPMVQLGHFQPAPHGGLGEAGLIGDLLFGVAKDRELLEAPRLFVDCEIAALHIFQQHRGKLLGDGHVRHDAGQSFEPGQPRRLQATVADQDNIVAIAQLDRSVGIDINHRNDGEILKDADLLDAVGQLRQIAEVLARVIGMWM